MVLEKILEETRVSMEALKDQITRNRYEDVFGAMKRIKEEDRSDFFKAFFSELNWRLNDPNNENPIYKDVADKFNQTAKQ